jgi:prepilin-type N-terminal cleavage/methylation domain-containing protein
MMINRLKKIVYDNKGLTLIELSIASLITGIILTGLGITVIASTGSYQNDWVMNELRNYGYYSVKTIKEYVRSAENVSVDNWNGYDRLSVNQKNNGLINIYALENEGFFIEDRPMDPHVKFPNGGAYRVGDQRKVTIDKFVCRNLDGLEDHGFSASLYKKFRKSVWLIELNLKVSTKYPDGEEGFEILKIRDRFFVGKEYGS